MIGMEELIKLLDRDLDYEGYEIQDGIIYIKIKSSRTKAICPYCGKESSKVHSRYKRKFQDLPIQGKKVIMVIENRKIFCGNRDCEHFTFAERFDFLSNKSKRTKRLEDEVVRISLHCSSVTAANILSKGIADIHKSAICELLKKRRSGDR